MNTKFRKTLRGLFTGAEFEIVRVSVRQFIEEIGDLPISLAKAVQKEISTEEQLAKMTPEQHRESERRAQVCMLTHGVKRVRFPGEEEWTAIEFWFGPEDQCPANATIPTDLGSDLDSLVQAVTDLSFKPEGVGALERFFRREGSTDPGLGGPTLLPETLVASSNGDSTGAG